MVLESCGQVWKLQNAIQAGMMEGDPTLRAALIKECVNIASYFHLRAYWCLLNTQIYILLVCSMQGFIVKFALLVLRVYTLQMVNFTSSPLQHVFGIGIAFKNL